MMRYIGFATLLAVWVALCGLLVVRNGGITLYNIIVMGCSGFMIFMPLWKKYKKDE